MRVIVPVLVTLACVTVAGSAMAVEISGDTPPEGFHLVAEDNCGTASQTHVVAGTSWLYPVDMVDAPPEHRAIVFDNNACVFWYTNPKPAAAYKVDVVYVDNGGRVQRLDANGRQVHGSLELPVRTPKRLLLDIPKEAYADGGKLELKFTRLAGANAIVSYVRIWSTDPAPLGAPSAKDRAASRPPRPPSPKQPKPLWLTDDPVEREWMRQDGLVCRPTGDGWEEPDAVVQDRLIPAVEKHLRRCSAVAADMRRLGVTEISGELKELDDVLRSGGDRVPWAARPPLSSGDSARADKPPMAPTPEASEKSNDLDSWKSIYLDTHRIARQLTLSHPRLHQGQGLVFVRRHHPTFGHQCARRRSRYATLGGEICLLPEIRSDMRSQPVSLTEGQFPEGLFGRPDVSFDGRRMVFGFAAADVKDLDEGVCESRGGQSSVGNGTFFQVWEMPTNGSTPPRQVTHGTTRREESTDPIYLPDGRIAFMSPRAGGMVMCGDWAWADCMFSVRADGSELRQVTRAKEGEWDPALMDDGTIMFTRWEYVMRFWRPTQLIWNVRPDGTYPRIIGGYLTVERNYARCRQVPGTSKVVCVEAHHHNDGSGNILVVDLRHGRDTAEGEQCLVSGAADCPFPIDENYFLISYDPQGTGASDNRKAGRVGIYLADVHGGLELIYRDASLSAMYPTLLQSRPVPPVLPEVRPQDAQPTGQFVVQDVYRGLPEGMRGKARYLRLVEAHERHIHTSPCNIWVGMGGFETKTVLGCVPIESDGSAYFRVPANRAVFFSVLNKDYRALHTMRMTTYVQPGETVGCVGCHEPMTAAPPIRRSPMATRRDVSALEPPPWGLQAFGYPKLVQPILDARCVRCHDGTEGKEKSFDLRVGTAAPETFVPNLWTVYDVGYKAHYTYPSYWALLPHVKYADIHNYHTPPGSWGSLQSPLMNLLAKGHKDVVLTSTEWRTLCAWIDCNVPYLDDFRKFAVDPEIRKMSRVRLDAPRATANTPP